MLRFYSSGLSASAVQFSKSLQFFTGHEMKAIRMLVMLASVAALLHS